MKENQMEIKILKLCKIIALVSTVVKLMELLLLLLLKEKILTIFIQSMLIGVFILIFYSISKIIKKETEVVEEVKIEIVEIIDKR